MDLLIFFLPVILVLGVITSREDIKFNRISNKYTVGALILSGIIHLYLFFAGYINSEYLTSVGINVLIALVISFTLYMAGYWSPGDAKLFVAYMSLIPLNFYQNVGINLKPMTLLVNTFLPVFVYLIIWILIKTNKKLKLGIIKNILKPKIIGQYLLLILATSWIVRLLFQYAGIEVNILYNMLGIVLLRYILKKIFPLELNYLLAFLALLRIVLFSSDIFRLSFVKNFLLLTLAYMLFIVFVSQLGRLMIKEVRIKDLKQGMVPAEIILKNHKKKAITNHAQFSNERGAKYQARTSGLTKSDIKKIKSLKLEYNTLKVHESIPFAPFMFGGALLTMLFKGNVVAGISLLIKSIFS